MNISLKAILAAALVVSGLYEATAQALVPAPPRSDGSVSEPVGKPQPPRPDPDQQARESGPRTLFWKSEIKNGDLLEPKNWSLLSKAERADQKRRRESGERIPPEVPIKSPPSYRDSLIFEDDVRASMSKPMEVTSLVFGDHNLELRGYYVDQTLKVGTESESCIPGASQGGKLQLSTCILETGPVRFGDAIALLPSAPRNTVTLPGGASWKASGLFSFGAGTLKLQGGSLIADVVAVTEDSQLEAIGGTIQAETMLELGPMSTGHLQATGIKLRAPTLVLAAGRGPLLLRNCDARASAEAELDILDGSDGGIALLAGTGVVAPLITLHGEGHRGVRVEGGRSKLEAEGLLQVSAGWLDEPGLNLVRGGKAVAETAKILQGVVEVGEKSEFVADQNMTVDEGVLRLAGGAVQTGELVILAADANPTDVVRRPERSRFRTVSGGIGSGTDEQGPPLNQGLDPAVARSWVDVLADAAAKATTPTPELQLLSRYVDRMRSTKMTPANLQALSDEFRAQLDAMHRALSEDDDKRTPEDGGANAPPISAATREKMLAAIARANSDLRAVSSLGQLDAIMRRVTDQLNGRDDKDSPSGAPGQAPEPPLPPASPLLTTRLGGPSRPSVLEGFGTIQGVVKNAAELRPGSPGKPLESLAIDGEYQHQLAGSIIVHVDGATLPARYDVSRDYRAPLKVTGRMVFDQPAHYLSQTLGPEAVAAVGLAPPAAGVMSSSAIRVKVQNASELKPGGMVTVARVADGEIVGRPPRFASARIENQADVFFGIDCDNEESYSGDIPFRQLNLTAALRLLVLRAPRILRVGDGDAIAAESLLTPGVKLPSKLVIATHGTTDRVEADEYNVLPEGGMLRVAAEMARFAHHTGLEDQWGVAIFDWREFATGVDDTHGFGKWNPWESARIGREIGMSLVDLILDGDLDYTDLREIHILGHSSGTWLIDGFAQRLHERSLEFGPAGAPRLQVTAFDAFMWPENELGTLSAAANVTEQYLDLRLYGTRSPHPYGANIDVTWLDPGLSNELQGRFFSPLWHGPIPTWEGDAGEQATPDFPGMKVLGGFKVTCDMPSNEVLEGLAKKYPWEAFRYSTLDPVNTFGHSWPFEWYARTIEAAGGKPFKKGAVWCTNLCWQRWGFATSPMYADFLRRQGLPVEDRLQPLLGAPIRVLPGDGDCEP